MSVKKKKTDGIHLLPNQRLWKESSAVMDKEEYARELNRLANLLENRKYKHTLNFLYATDIAARMPHEVARDLIELIGDYDDDVIYGYAGRGVCAAKFADFKEILQDAYKTRKGFWWR